MVCIVRAVRTPQGRFLGALTKRSAVDLAVAAGEPLLAGIDPGIVGQVVLGNVLQAGQGMNPARQVALRLGLPVGSTAYTVNMMCASGLQAVALAAQAIRAGEAEVVLCGGTESMSNAPYALDRARGGYRLGDGTLTDLMLRDGLVDPLLGEHMGLSAERLADRYRLTREEQDAFALRSQQRYAAAEAAGLFDVERVPLQELARDEHPRPETTAEKLAALAPAFKEDGTVTAGNASGINDAAALLLLCDERTASREGWRPLATVGPWATAGCDPQLMGLGPVVATCRLCERHGLSVADFDTVELNEAFAAQALACVRALELDPEIVNPEGGAIALGHPIGASGARLLVHLAHKVASGRARRGLATLCVGGGMGGAMVVEAG